MTLPIRYSIRILLLNQANELLLMCANDPKTTTVDGKSSGKYWFTIGGEIEKDESLEEAAKRELFEETGLSPEAVTFGPIVWHGDFHLILYGKKTHLKQKFIVARTKETTVTLNHLTEEEKSIIQKLEWFSLDKMRQSQDVIYPIDLPDYLPEIIAGNYPTESLEIDLAKEPEL
ncbi:MAG: NUDIX domain-containing protein [Simkania sp.]|nr:NUDIX domain-containing protein [Simkania sp.]